MVLVAVLGVGGSSDIGGSLFVGGSLICRREFSVAVGRCWFFHVDGWVRRVSVTRGSRMIQDQRLYFVATVLCCNGYFLATATFFQRLLSDNGYFLATATFGGGDLLVMGLFAIRRAILTGRNLDIF